MLHKLLRLRQDGLTIIDSQFPQAEPQGFRNIEINEYLKRVKNSRAYAMPVTKPGPLAWFAHDHGVTPEQFKINKSGYARHYPKLADKVNHLDAKRYYKFELAYTIFLSNTYLMLPFFKRNNVPFVFTLYPGGGFGLDNKSSDDMLKAVFASPNFRAVIPTQVNIRNYLIKKKLCPADKIEYIFGGFAQFRENEVKAKKFYPKDKLTFDICFVAAKYSERGEDKGYDLFIDAAKLLAKQSDDFRFHIVGEFDKSDIEVSELGDRIKFYGFRQKDWLRDFYPSIDVLISPSRPFKLYKGNFDGFHLGLDASFNGVALFVSDELKLNQGYSDGKDIVIIKLDAKKIAADVMGYYKQPAKLYGLAKAGQKITQKVFGIDYQINARLAVFKHFADLKVD